MIRILFVLFFLFLETFHAQSFKFAWLTDTHIGAGKASVYLSNCVRSINSTEGIKFTVVTGDISEKGKNSELEEAKRILDSLTVPYYIIPGNHDTKWSESGTNKFKELWGDNKFMFETEGRVFIGINSGILLRGGGGHVTPEDLEWLENSISGLSEKKEIYFFIHHPLDSEIDNWFKVTNILRKKNIKAVFTGHHHKNELTDFNFIPAVKSRSTLADLKTGWGYSVVEDHSDSLKFFEVDSSGIPVFWGSFDKQNRFEVPRIDSLQFINYGAEILWQANYSSTTVTPLLVYDNKIFTADFAGKINALDFSGNKIWDYSAFGNITGKPAAADAMLACGTLSGDLITLDANTGMNLQTIGFDQPVTSQLNIFDYTGEKELMMPKYTNSNAAVLLGTASGKLYCYDLETLEEIWSNNSAGGMIETKPLYLNDRLYFGAWDGYFYSIDARKGWLLWKWTENKNFYFSPAACIPVSDGKHVFFATPEKMVYSFDLLLGKMEWSVKNTSAWESIGISSDTKELYVKGMDGQFFILNSASGRLLKKINAGYGTDTQPSEILEFNGNILLGGKDGNIYLIDKKHNTRKILFMGTARIHSLVNLYENVFAAYNMDGNLIAFKIN